MDKVSGGSLGRRDGERDTYASSEASLARRAEVLVVYEPSGKVEDREKDDEEWKCDGELHCVDTGLG